MFDGVTDETSEPTAIYPLNPAYMTVRVGASFTGVMLTVTFRLELDPKMPVAAIRSIGTL